MTNEVKIKKKFKDKVEELSRQINGSEASEANRKQPEEVLSIVYDALNSSVNGVIITDLKGLIRYVNSAFLKIFAYEEKSEILGSNAANLFPGKEVKKFADVKAIIDEKRGETEEFIAQRKDGKAFYVEVSSSNVTDVEGNIVGRMASFIDVTDRKRTEEKLRVMKAQKIESLGVLAGGIAHDFNNLLTAILGNIELAQIHMQPGRKIYKRLSEAKEACMRAKGLTQKFITFSEGGNPIKRVGSLIELLKESANLALSGSNATCRFYLPEDLWMVEFDEGQLQQAIHNLITNADDALPDGGIIKIIAENVIIESGMKKPNQGMPDGRFVKISIQDHGIGIPKEHMSKVFDPYFSTKGMSSRKGTGLGLSVAYSIIINHNGYIHLESDARTGTTVNVYIPASLGDIHMKKKKEGQTITAPKKILLMDDEQIVRDVAGEMLKCMGYEVEFAVNGKEAIDLYKKAKEAEHPFDAVILDLTVRGGMGGKDAIRKLLELDPCVKAILSSGYTNEPIMNDYEKYGFSGTYAKPYRLRELDRILNQIMEGKDN